MNQPSKLDRYGSLIVDLTSNILIITILLVNFQSYLVKFIAIFIPVIYYPILHTLWSRSIGDLVFNLKVVNQQGNKIDFRLARKRFFCIIKYSIVVLLYTNLLMIVFLFRNGQNIREVSLDFEGESQTYLVKAS
jgi:uncharacterized RDD family membrane protein YckC